MSRPATAPEPLPPRANPFRSARLEQLRFRLEEGWDVLWARLEALAYRAALVGPEGSGKTTLLAEIAARLASEGWRLRPWRLCREQRRPSLAAWRALLARLGPRDLVIIDGAEQLAVWRWQWLVWASRRAGGLIVTSQRAGLLPTLRTHRTDLDLLEDLVGELAGPAAAKARRPELEQLFAAHGGNLRECLRSLYDLASCGA